MKVDLTKEDLIILIKGSSPCYKLMSHPLIAANGYYVGGFVDHWEWNHNAFKNCTEEQVYEVYLLIKSGGDGV